MNEVSPASDLFSSEAVAEEIARFLDAAQQRCEILHSPRRRRLRHYHNAWPLEIRLNHNEPAQEFAAALHNATDVGLAFLSPRQITSGTRIFVKLFWHEADAPRVPAVVRHNTPTEQGNLVGCEFLLAENGDKPSAG